jgi:hypothetical protein
VDYRNPTPAETVTQVAARHRCYLTAEAAAEIAAAVLLCADSTYQVRHAVTPEMADIPEALGSLRKSMNRQLAVGLLDAGVLPVTLPRETVMRPVASYGLTVIEYSVPVRRPVQVPTGDVILSGGYYTGRRIQVPATEDVWLMPEPPADTLMFGMIDDSQLGFGETPRHLLYRWTGHHHEGARLFGLDPAGY